MCSLNKEHINTSVHFDKVSIVHNTTNITDKKYDYNQSTFYSLAIDNKNNRKYILFIGDDLFKCQWTRAFLEKNKEYKISGYIVKSSEIDSSCLLGSKFYTMKIINYKNHNYAIETDEDFLVVKKISPSLCISK